MDVGTTLRIGRFEIQVRALNLILWSLGICFVLQFLLGRGIATSRGSLHRFSGSFDVEALWAAGADGPLALTRSRELWRVVTAMFLHGGAVHFLLNALSLVQLGNIAEVLYGPARLLTVFLLSGIAGNLASDAWYGWRGETTVSVGASGAVCGLLGLLVVHFKRRTDIVARQMARALVQAALLNLVLGLSMPAINNAAHIGGFLCGALLGFRLRPDILRVVGGDRSGVPLRVTTAVLALGAVVALVIAGRGAPERLATLHAIEILNEDIESLHLLASQPGAVDADAKERLRRRLEVRELTPILHPFRERAMALLDTRFEPFPDRATESALLYGDFVRACEDFAPDIYIATIR